MYFLKIIKFAVFLAILVSQNVSAKKYFPFLQRNDPPPHNNVALMARYIAHNSNWASVGTISVTDPIQGYPFVGLKSISDGPEHNGTGVPYMLMTDMDISMNDLNHDNRCTLFISLAQENYCKNKNYDPQDPRCARIMLTGNIEKVKINSTEEVFAKSALYSKHPAMNYWPTDHGFFIAKMNIKQVFVLDFFGGIKKVTPEAYFAANLNSNDLIDRLAREIEVIQINF